MGVAEIWYESYFHSFQLICKTWVSRESLIFCHSFKKFLIQSAQGCMALRRRMYFVNAVMSSPAQCVLCPLYTGCWHWHTPVIVTQSRRADTRSRGLPASIIPTEVAMAGVSALLQSVTSQWRKQSKPSTSRQKTSSLRRSVRASRRKRADSEEDSFSTSSDTQELEVIAPRLSDLQFKYNWDIKHFVDKVLKNFLICIFRWFKRNKLNAGLLLPQPTRTAGNNNLD